MKDLGGLRPRLLASNATTLATCWRVRRQDGAVFRYTDHDRDLLVANERYRANTGYKRSAVQSGANAAVDNMDIEGVVGDDGSITDADVRRGLWDYAEVRIFAVDWREPDAGRCRLRRGWVGEVQSDDAGAFRAELRGLQQLLTQNVGEIYSPECRAQLGDARCGVDLSLFRATGAAMAPVLGPGLFAGVLGPEYEGGVLEFTGGANAGARREILRAGDGAVELFLPMPFAVAEGDPYLATQGCDHRRKTCRDRFDNILRFRGEPDVPGADALLFVGIPDAGAAGGKK